MSAVGLGSGFTVALLARWMFVHWLHVKITLEVEAVSYVFFIGLLSGLLGALHPALRAANQVPLTALSYE